MPCSRRISVTNAEESPFAHTPIQVSPACATRSVLRSGSSMKPKYGTLR